MRLSGVLTLGMRAALVAVIAAQALYLARRPLCERWLCDMLARLASEELGARVTIGGLGGDWFRHAIAQDVAVHGPSALLGIEGAEVAAELGLWRLLHGDLSGLQRARIRARRLSIDLRAPSTAAGPPGPPPDLAPYAALLPGGADVVIDVLAVQGTDTRRDGPARARLAPSHGPGPRRLVVDAPGLALEAELHASGAFDVCARTDDVGRLIRLAGPDLGIQAGPCEAHAKVTLAPRLAVSARARLGACEVHGQPITSAAAHARLDAEAVRDLEVAFTLPGVSGCARLPVLAFADAGIPSGHARLATEDVAPWVARLPADLRNALPLAGPGNFRCTLAAGKAAVDVALVASGLLPAVKARVALRARAGEMLALDGFALDSPFLQARARATVRGVSLRDGIADPAAILSAPLHADVDVHGADLRRVGLDRFGVSARGRARITGRLAGTLARPDPHLLLAADGVALGPTLADAARTVPWCTRAAAFASIERSRLLVDRASARVGTEEIALRGGADLRDGTLTLVEVAIVDAHEGRLRIDGALPWRGDLDWRAMLGNGADLRAEVTGIDPGAWFARHDIGARVSGTAYWRTRGAIDVGADLAARAERIAGLGEPVTATAVLHGDATATRATDIRVALGPARLRGSAAVACSPNALLAAAEAFTTANAHADLDLVALPLAELLAWLGTDLGLDELRGTLSGKARVRGTCAAPDVAATLDLTGAALRTTTGERLDDVAATLELTPRSVRIVQATAKRGTGPLALTGELTAAAPLWQAWPAANLSLVLQGRNVLVYRRAGLKVRADLDLTASGPLTGLAITGRIDARDSRLVTRVPFFDLRRSGGAGAGTGLRLPGVALPPPLHASLDVEIATAEPFAVKTNVLEGDLHAQFELLGDLQAPRLQGTLSGPDTTVILPGCRLRASALLLQFTADNPDVPTLTMTARGRRHGYDILVNARGPYDHPDIEFSSDPTLPPDELVILVTTGARPSALRGTRGVGTVLGAYVAQEFADWAFGSESTEAKERFLDRFTLETGTEISRGGNESIVVEFRVGDRLYMQGERDVYDDLNMGLVYRLRFR